jgi:hypothetical protein
LNNFSCITINHYELAKMHTNQKTSSKLAKETDYNRRLKILKSKMAGKNLFDFGFGNGIFLFKSIKFITLSQGVKLE